MSLQQVSEVTILVLEQVVRRLALSGLGVHLRPMLQQQPADLILVLGSCLVQGGIAPEITLVHIGTVLQGRGVRTLRHMVSIATDEEC